MNGDYIINTLWTVLIHVPPMPHCKVYTSMCIFDTSD